MRPLDRKNAAPRPCPFYDQTFDNSTGAPLLKLHDYAYTVKTANNAAYQFFLNGNVFNPGTEGGRLPVKPVIIPGNPPGTTHVFATHNMPPRVIAVANRDNTAPNITINTLIQEIQVTTAQKTRQYLRILIPVEETADLARLYRDEVFNGPPRTFPLAGAVGTEVANELFEKISHSSAIQVDDAPGTYRGYSGAKKDLMIQLGGYCSFCETAYQDGRDLDIEHRVAKSDYWTEYLRWDNFVLGCSLCNSDYKHDFPNRNYGIVQAAAGYYPGAALVRTTSNNVVAANGTKATVGGALLLYHDILRACNEYIQWPDQDDGGVGAPHPTNLGLRLFRYELHTVDAAGISTGVINDADAVHPWNRRVAVQANQILQADVWDSTLVAPGLRQTLVQVRVVLRQLNTGAVAFDARKNNGTQQMIQMVGLNDSLEPVRDQRMLARTKAWFRAINALAVLAEQLTALETWRTSRWRWLIYGEPAIRLNDQQWDSICDLAEITGFYSVWITVFKHWGHNLAQVLARRLHNRAMSDPNAVDRFRGSDLNNSVLTQIQHIL